MRIFVCIKQVPDTETRIKINSAGDQIDEAGIKWIINPYDEFAIEEAIRFKEKHSDARVTAITVGPKARVNNALLTAMAMGADDSIIIDAATTDSLTAAKLMAAAMKKEGPAHAIFTGKLGIDHNANAVGPMLAELLEIPHCSVVGELNIDDANSLKASREVEGGQKETYQLPTPALIAANKGLNKPRFASLPGIMKAKKKPIVTMTADELGVDIAEPKITMSHFELPPERPDCIMIEGDTSAQAQDLVRRLREEARVL